MIPAILRPGSSRTSAAAGGLHRGAAVTLAALALAVLGLACVLGGGPKGLAYVFLYLLATVPGWPVGAALFGRRHAATWIVGPLIGYALTAGMVWAVIVAGLAGPLGFAAGWAAIACTTALLCRRVAGPLVRLPSWGSRETAALAFVLLLVPALTGPAFRNVGRTDAEGRRYYRAYFTADFVWHMALVSELERFDARPSDPYAADQPLHYYWTYFMVPAAADAVGPKSVLPSREAILLINAVMAGLLFTGAVFLLAWIVVPQAAAAAPATMFAFLAGSLEGLYAAWTLHARGAPLGELRNLNIDAITLWFFRGLTIDGLPRSLWYTPQHAGACALGLAGLAVVASEGSRAKPAAIVMTGVALAASLAFSPFLGGAFVLVYGITVTWDLLQAPKKIVWGLARHVLAALPVLAALGWVVGNDMLAGAGEALHIGFLAGNARHEPVLTLVLAIGPLLLLALPGLWPNARSRHARPAVAGLAVGLALFYWVSLPKTDPIWVGWRAGQVMLVTLPALGARGIVLLTTARRLRPIAIAAIVTLFAAGLPTTVIDAWNAQDIANTNMGPGFPWTTVLDKDEQAALEWVRRATRTGSVVQVDPAARGRATWSLIPTFGERRMAAGLPISLVAMPYYKPRTDEVGRMYATTDAREAWEIATRLGIDYVYVGSAERGVHAPDALAKFRSSPLFMRVYGNDTVEVFGVARRPL
ncbi:MAG: hypothetical protein ACE148_07765 [Vicinamibacterales bacterium]